MSELPVNTVLMGESNYRAALDLVIRSAQNTLCIFDQDLRKGHYASLSRYEALHAFLAANKQNRLVMILNDLDYFSSDCPRLAGLLQRYSHAMTVYETNQQVKQLKDSFVLADGGAYIRRFHIDQARFKYGFTEAETAAMLKMRFEELLQNTGQSVSSTTLGL